MYIFFALALNNSVSLDALQFPMQNIYESRDLSLAVPMGGATSSPASNIVCLLTFA